MRTAWVLVVSYSSSSIVLPSAAADWSRDSFTAVSTIPFVASSRTKAKPISRTPRASVVVIAKRGAMARPAERGFSSPPERMREVER